MRSLLFVPGDSQRKLEKGLGSQADIILIDLEDSVAPSAKQDAREMTAAFLREVIPSADRPKFYVRVNDLSTGLTEADLDAVVAAGAEGILLPKALAGRDVTELDAMLAVREATHGLEDGVTPILVIATEAASALFTLASFTGCSKRLAGLAWGAEDLSADLGAATNRDETGAYTEPFRLARNLALAAAVAAQVTPIDTVYTNFRDLDGLRAESEIAKRDGFTAKFAIHPAQVPVINAVFTPSADEIAHARRIIEAFAEAGDAGVIAMDGEMLDVPHLKRAERMLARARDAG